MITLIVLGLLDFEIAGYKISQFQWYWALLIIGGVLIVMFLFYFLYVWVFGKMKMTKDQEKALVSKAKTLKKASKEEKKAAQSQLSSAERHVLKWNKMKAPLVSVVSVFTVIGVAAAAVLPTVWEQLMNTINVNRGVGGDNQSESAQEAIGAAKDNVTLLEKEGIVLLKNNDDVLPLNKEVNNKVNIFGSSAFGMLYGGGGSGVFITNNNYNGNDFHATRFEDAMVNEGFEYNEDLYNLVANYYESGQYKITPTDYDISCQNNAFVGNTIVNGVQLVDDTCFPYDHEPGVDAYLDGYDGISGTLLESAQAYSDTAIYAVSRAGSEDGDMSAATLDLTDREEAMVKFLADNFEKVIFLINSSNVMELGELDLPGVDAVLWIGHPGLTGNKAVAKTISGEYNPSGRLVDTWTYDINDVPSFQSFGPDTTDTYSGGGRFVEYLEGIYVGYRYFTTRAYDDPTFIYDDIVQYSFGEGYSYTTFNEVITDSEIDEQNEKIKITVEVENTGTEDGKDVIELYHTAPYTPGGIEVPYVALCAFDKTPVIKAGEKYTQDFEISYREIASWDNDNAQYVLEDGVHSITIRKNAWEICPAVGGDNEIVFTLDEDVEYKTSYQTGYEYDNQFSDAEHGPANEEIQYLSRSDFEATFTMNNEISNECSAYTRSEQNNKSYADKQVSGNVTTGARNGLVLADLKGKDYDDEDWDLLLDQLSVNDMINLVDNGGFQTAAISSIGKRATYDDDGPASIQIKGTGYASEVVVASSWDPYMAQVLGESAAREGAAMGLTGWYAPGMNIHRCPTGGRNFEYFSEDPLITGKMGGAEAKGTAKYGVYTYAKHFALNEQETSRAGLNVWASEQAIREIYLRGFEIYSDEGGLGFMSSFSRIGAVWSGAHYGLCTEVLRNEWGFNGVVVTDYVNASLMPVNMGIRGGNDLWLIKNSVYGAREAYLEAPHDSLIYMREACHHILYACAQSNCVWTEEDYEDVGILDVNWDLAGYLDF